MEVDLARDLPVVTCLPGLINQVILNIVVNAAHAIGDVVGGAGTRAASPCPPATTWTPWS